jgi:hypothetical protein
MTPPSASAAIAVSIAGTIGTVVQRIGAGGGGG